MCHSVSNVSVFPLLDSVHPLKAAIACLLSSFENHLGPLIYS